MRSWQTTPAGDLVIGPDHWFDGARFGMFVHWGHASQHGRELSWPLVGGNPVLPSAHPTPVEDYYADHLRFRPEPARARNGWRRPSRRHALRGADDASTTTASRSGRRRDYSIARPPYGGDLVREFADAARAEGLRVGFYFSLPDWHHPDYPAFTDADRPVHAAGRRTVAEATAWDRYLAHMRRSCASCSTGYGRVDLLWFDGGWERRPRRVAQRPSWRRLIRRLQPDIVVNDRLPGAGDYETPEQFAPATPPDGPWETCMTMNRTWGWCPDDAEWKSARDLVHTLCQVAAGGGNLLLNVSPRGDGALPAPHVERLAAIAGLDGRATPTRSTTRRPAWRRGSSTDRPPGRATASSSTA